MNAIPIDRRSLLQAAGGATFLAATGSFLGACSTGSPSSTTPTSGAAAGTPKAGGKAVMSFRAAPVNMDPADGQLYSSLQVYQNIFSSLISVDADYKYSPNLASSWAQEDEKTWKFTLVDNAVFQNNEPVTSKDVAFTINRIKDGHPLGAFFSAFESVEIVDDHNFRIHLASPYGPFEATLSYLLSIVNEKATTSQNPKLKPVGCGPYQMAEWVQGDHVTLKRWDKYFKDGQPYLDEIRMQTYTSPTIALAGLRSKQLDWIELVPEQQVPQLQSATDIAHTPSGPFLPYMLNLNNTRAPFNDPRVRQAVAWAINRADIQKVVFADVAATATTEPTAPDSPWYSGIDPYKGGPNLDKARDLMKQAGVTSVDVVFIAETAIPQQAAIAQVLQSNLAPIGINIKIQQYASAQWIGLRANHQFDMSVSYFSVALDPGQTYYLQCHSGSPFNRSKSNSPAVDAAVQKVMFTSDPEARKAAYGESVQAVAEDASVLFLAMADLQYWSQRGVHSMNPLPSLEVRLEDMWHG